MNLLLVEDDTDYANSLSEQLRGLDHQVAVVSTASAALHMTEHKSFDAVILDYMLPRLNGAVVVEMLREGGKTYPVLMLSALGGAKEKVESLAAGADGYIVKPANPREIDARLRAIARSRGWTQAGDNALIARDITINPLRFRAWRDDHPLTLTRLEFKLLEELARNAGSVLTRAMLLERVWGYDFEPSNKFVDYRMVGLRRELQKYGDDPIVTKRGIGYMLRD